MSMTIALIGRPNVGKSSIFNRFAGKQMAIVHDTPGVTRDYKITPAKWGSYEFQVMDTAGLEQSDTPDIIHDKMQDQTLRAVAQSHVLLLIIDGYAGITAVDREMAQKIRQWNKPVILVINKSDTRKSTDTAYDAFSLGLGSPVLISAAHNQGFDDLYDELKPFLDEYATTYQAPVHDDHDNYDFDIEEGVEVVLPEEDLTKPIKIAIVGRPNVGKSTLLNAIIGEDRAITSPIAGTTRDTVQVQWEYKDRQFRLVDTAGLRKKYKIIDPLEKLSIVETQRAIRLAHVVLLVLDASQSLDHQDQAIAEHVINEGRALIVVMNKWDMVENPDQFRKEMRERFDHALAQIKNVPIVTLSALNGRNVHKALDAVIDIYSIWTHRTSTSRLNRWLERMESAHQPPMASGRANRLRYMTQIKVKPPTFALWVSRPDDLPDTYQRYLINGLREECDLDGVPIRLSLRKSKNPYTD
jgi:GTP-binding protein